MGALKNLIQLFKAQNTDFEKWVEQFSNPLIKVKHVVLNLIISKHLLKYLSHDNPDVVSLIYMLLTTKIIWWSFIGCGITVCHRIIPMCIVTQQHKEKVFLMIIFETLIITFYYICRMWFTPGNTRVLNWIWCQLENFDLRGVVTPLFKKKYS